MPALELICTSAGLTEQKIAILTTTAAGCQLSILPVLYSSLPAYMNTQFLNLPKQLAASFSLPEQLAASFSLSEHLAASFSLLEQLAINFSLPEQQAA